MKNPSTTGADHLKETLAPVRRPAIFPSMLLLSLLVIPASVQAATLPPLGTAASFGVLGASTVTNTGGTVVAGDLGVSPGTAVTGFPPGAVTGTIYTGVLSNAGPAQADALVAYNDAAGQACNTDLTGQDLGGLTLTPGVYCFDTSAQLTGTLTLDFLGNSSAVFIFQTGSTLTTASNSSVVAINGSPSCNNITWQIGSSATLGTDTDFLGNILALASITLNTTASSDGGLYALTAAVTLDTNAINACSAVDVPDCTTNADCTDDGNLCTGEVCNPAGPGADATGCTHPNNTIVCDDTLFCTDGDICGGGTCAGTPLDCGDGNVCTTDSCDDTADTCVNANNTIVCDDNLFCTDGDICGGGTCAGTPRNCGDAIGCTADACNESSNQCDYVPVDALCDDGDVCTSDICSAQTGCISDIICTDICRTPGYWGTHGGYEKKGSLNVSQSILDAAGGFDVCGELITTTSNLTRPYLSGLGLTSALEGLCVSDKGAKVRQLYRQLVAAAFNCTMSAGSDCDQVVMRYIDVSFSDCNTLCAGGIQPLNGPTIDQCVGQLDCFNNGGQIIDGKCAYGSCAVTTGVLCGAAYGSCPKVGGVSQACLAFPGNCHAAEVCNEDIGVCPKNTPASSSNACNEATGNKCTIDSCN